MLIHVNKNNIDKLSVFMDEYFHQRYLVFIERLQWSIASENFKEIDEYDTKNTEYLIYIHPKHGVCGGLRFNPTNKPYMLSNVFSYLVDNIENLPKSKNVWEASRFFLNVSSDKNEFIKKATKEIFLGALELGFKKKLNALIIVADLRIERIIRASGWHFNRLSGPKNCKDDPNLTSIAGTLEISKFFYKNIIEKSKIEGFNTFYSKIKK
ncbi:MAG: acyl-homoserine-lactone synthase [Alphaproteobacteria bacterium]|nr:acyl-homoserine-lactone synthase [Alphaproteobacteria bacterium]